MLYWYFGCLANGGDLEIQVIPLHQFELFSLQELLCGQFVSVAVIFTFYFIQFVGIGYHYLGVQIQEWVVVRYCRTDRWFDDSVL